MAEAVTALVALDLGAAGPCGSVPDARLLCGSGGSIDQLGLMADLAEQQRDNWNDDLSIDAVLDYFFTGLSTN